MSTGPTMKDKNVREPLVVCPPNLLPHNARCLRKAQALLAWMGKEITAPNGRLRHSPIVSVRRINAG